MDGFFMLERFSPAAVGRKRLYHQHVPIVNAIRGKKLICQQNRPSGCIGDLIVNVSGHEPAVRARLYQIRHAHRARQRYLSPACPVGGLDIKRDFVCGHRYDPSTGTGTRVVRLPAGPPTSPERRASKLVVVASSPVIYAQDLMVRDAQIG